VSRNCFNQANARMLRAIAQSIGGSAPPTSKTVKATVSRV